MSLGLEAVRARFLADGLSPASGCFLAWIQMEEQMCEHWQEEGGAAHPCTGSNRVCDSGKSMWPGISLVMVVRLGCKAVKTHSSTSCIPSFPSISETPRNIPEFSQSVSQSVINRYLRW